MMRMGRPGKSRQSARRADGTGGERWMVGQGGRAGTGTEADGHYTGCVILDGGQPLEIRDLTGFAEAHRVRW